ncbi:MAG: hypothetical protein ACOX6H_00690 [Christensenellales bacterium]|jgi:hypothetical protein
MIFILLFILLTGFIYVFSLKPKGRVKKKFNNKITFARFVEKKFFYYKLFSFHCPESKFFLREFGIKTALKTDEILKKIRLNTPSQTLTKDDFEILKKNKLTLPIFSCLTLPDFETLKLYDLCAALEDVCLVVFYKQQKEFFSSFKNIKFIKQKNDELFSAIKKANINFDVPKNITLYYSANLIDFRQKFVLSHFYQNGCLNQVYENKNFKIKAKFFFTGENVCVMQVQNKTQVSKELNFDIFYDLALNKLNYFTFVQNKNFVKILPLNAGDVQFLNFSSSPKKVLFSSALQLKNSNLPCVNLVYDEKFLPLEEKAFVFMLSKNIFPLKMLTLENLENISAKLIANNFNINLFTKDENFNNFFNKDIKLKGILELLSFSQNTMQILKKDFVSLKTDFESGKINEFCFYLSVRDGLVEKKENSFIINPYFIKGNFSFKLFFNGVYNLINVKQNNNQIPCIVLGGVKYYNNLEIPFSLLSQGNSPIAIEC